MTEQGDKHQLPKGWTWLKFDDFLDYIQPTPYIVESTEYNDSHKIPVLTAGKSFIKGYTNESNGIFNSLPVIIFDDFTTANKFVNFPFKVKSSAMKILKPKDENVNLKFAFYYMQTVRVSFDTHKRYWISVFSKLPIPSPPKPSQQAIVSKIEELFSELDKGIESLLTAKQQLKTYRQSVLKWAFEGKLTNEYIKDGELPTGWKRVKLGELMGSVRNGYSKKPDEIGQFKILRISSVRPNKVDINEVRFLEKEIGIENSLLENDLLFTRYNGSIDFVGVCGRVPKLSEKLFYPDKLIRCRPKMNEWFHAAYIDYASNSRLARQFVLSKIKTTAGQTGISGSDIKEIPISLAPIKEQNLIVQAIESRLSVADKMEESITQSLQQAEALKQSILKKAFEGKLL